MASTGDSKNAKPIMDSAQHRLLFWLWTPYLSDAALLGIGWWLLAAGDDGGWWAIAFALVRAIVGTASILFALKKFTAERYSRG